MKFLLRLFLRVFFGFRVENESVLDTPGPVMLLPNHCSLMDWLFLAACLDRRWRFVTSLQVSKTSWLHRLIMVNPFTFPVEPESPHSVKHMADYLHKGGRLVLFPEGRLTRTGSLMKFFDGTGFLLFKTKAKVITCYLRGTNRCLYSPNPCHKRLFPRVSAHFSGVQIPPQPKNMSTSRARLTLTNWLHDRMVLQQFEVELKSCAPTLLETIIQVARQFPGKIIVQDFQLTKLSYRKLLIAVDALAAQWNGLLPPDKGERVGVMLPNANAMPLALMSLWSVDKVPAILNFSSGMMTMLRCIETSGVKRVVTSRKFIAKAGIDLKPMLDAGVEIFYLEDVKDRIRGSDRLRSFLRICLNMRLALHSSTYGETAVILFTSGSDGPPKAVELTHRNILANVWQMLSVIDLTERDRVCNVLPVFHSFGLTVGLLLPLVRGCYVFLYPSPLHFLMVPTVIYDFDCSVFFGTNTFLNGYGRKAHAYDFRSLRLLFAGSEKIQASTSDLWARRFGVRVFEGYGTTECSPVVSANTALFPRFGSAGRILPGIEYRLEPVEGVTEGGRLWLRGPNIMRGYLNPDANSQFLKQDGWHDTGDIARVDDDGYLYILGRLKRFAKISGEMISLTAVEDALVDGFGKYGEHCEVVIVSRHDADRGESLVAVTNEPKLALAEIRDHLKQKGLENLSLPRELILVSAIPKLGSGKTNYRELQKMLFKE
mgnify:CR=1 FL=1